MTEQKAKVFVFGFSPKLDDEGNAQFSEDANRVAEWMRDDNAQTTDELGRLLRIELAAEKSYREMLASEINRIRNRFLDKANAVIPDLTNPGKTIVEAYNNGMKMGEHKASVELAQQLSDMMDKLHIMNVVQND